MTSSARQSGGATATARGHPRFDQSIVQAVKRSAFIRWLLKFKQQLKPDDMRRNVEEFSEQYLSIENETGILPQDGRFDVSHFEMWGSSLFRFSAATTGGGADLLVFPGHDDIVQARYDETNGWPISRPKLFRWLSRCRRNSRASCFPGGSAAWKSHRLRRHQPNVCDADEARLVQMVDRGALTPNEWRRILNLPIQGGDQPIRRLDTDVVDDTGDVEGGEN